MLPLHHALEKQASEAVVAALLAANPDALMEQDNVRLPRPRNHPHCVGPARSHSCEHPLTRPPCKRLQVHVLVCLD